MYKRILFSAVLLGLSILAHGQTAKVPQPPPELRQLDVWVGNWSCEATAKATNTKYKSTMQCAWFQGGAALECRSQYTLPQASSDVMIWGYSAYDKAFTMYSYNQLGVVRSVAMGQRTSTTWTYERETPYQGKLTKYRLEGKTESPSKFSFQWSRPGEGGLRVVTTEGGCTKE